jgi:predicted metal-binding protein
MAGYQKFVKRAVALGADDAKIIKTDTTITGPWVRWKCKYGCDGYNSSLCCPPNTPYYHETRELVDSYEKALLVHCTVEASQKKDLSNIVVTLERDVFLAGHFEAFALGAGPCNLCGECSMDVCRHADKARPSMESCGIDVFSTARNNGYTIKVLADYSYTMNRFGLVLTE